MNEKTLSKTVVFLGKNKKGTHQREGFQTPDGLVFLPPKSVKAVEAWKRKMAEKGYNFGG